MADSRWGSILGGAAGIASACAFGALVPIALPIVGMAGVISKVNGGSFTEGMERLTDPVTDKFDAFIDAAEQFGDDYAEELTKGAKFVGKQAAGGVISVLTGRWFGVVLPKRPPA